MPCPVDATSQLSFLLKIKLDMPNQGIIVWHHALLPKKDKTTTSRQGL
jgi:hypothetical protein